MNIAWTLMRPKLLAPTGFLIVAGDRGILRTTFRRGAGSVTRRELEKLLAPLTGWREAVGDRSPASRHLRQAVNEMEAYFRGTKPTFRVALDFRGSGTPFQQKVWKRLSAVGLGKLTTYGRLASGVRAAGASRAVGGAVGRNPLPIIVPCHRVVGAGGRLTGFSSGLDLKVILLEHEGIHVSSVRTLAFRKAAARALRQGDILA